MKNEKRIAALLLGLLLTVHAGGQPVWAAVTTVSHPLYGENPSLTGQDAAGRPDGMDEAAWAALCDDTIEYSEIPELVEYRSILGQTQSALISANSAAQVQMSDAWSGAITELRDTISDLREQAGEVSTEEEKKALLGQVKLLEQSLNGSSGLGENQKQTKSSISTLVTKLKQGLYPTKLTMIAGMNSAFIAYQSLAELQKMYTAQVTMYQSMYERAQRQEALGMSTALDTQLALAELQGAELQLSDADEKLRSVQYAMALTLGWSADAAAKVHIGTLPAYDPDYMAGRNLTEDIAEAKLYNVSYGTAMGTVEKNITGYTEVDINRRSAEQNLNVTMSELYQNAEQAGTEYEAAELGRQVSERQKQSADRMYNAGLLSLPDYKGALLQYIASDMQAGLSAVNASAAVLNYQAALRGIV